MNRYARTAPPALVFCLAIGFVLAASAGVPETTDGDNIPDVLDKCMLDSRNAQPPRTCDTDQDGYGNVCDADFNQDGLVTPSDFVSFFIPAFKGLVAPTHGEDMDCDGQVLPTDFTSYFVPKFKGANGGAVPGPSGLSCAGTQGCQ
jgi:hypothetical protein